MRGSCTARLARPPSSQGRLQAPQLHTGTQCRRARQLQGRRRQRRQPRKLSAATAAAAAAVTESAAGPRPPDDAYAVGSAAAEAAYNSFDWNAQWYPVAFARDMPEGAGASAPAPVTAENELVCLLHNCCANAPVAAVCTAAFPQPDLSAPVHSSVMEAYCTELLCLIAARREGGAICAVQRAIRRCATASRAGRPGGGGRSLPPPRGRAVTGERQRFAQNRLQRAMQLAEQGDPAAVADRCRHRAAALSQLHPVRNRIPFLSSGTTGIWLHVRLWQ